ncbi:EAL domain-containing protein [Catenovulum sp. 2E275]|uniref:bifunctional diguanylate cyclase/phosphodiesterase n=1 Tax=Catenovulum sp. 2E275 TaxID=2980497 RepID=UPI0021D014FD|nr:EAL domain-containing protein [Catenovulum sp. 2E275]MCU4675227.1 EAL domain-containing protein [Catenovulum sp. 2E275]
MKFLTNAFNKNVNLLTFIFTTLTTIYIIFAGHSIRFEQGLNLVLHLMAELVSVFVFISVVLLVFFRFTHQASKQGNIIVLGFTLVGVADFIHALAYPGMPDFFTPSSTEKAIFFWFIARTAELITFILLASKIRLPGRKLIWLSLSLAIAGVVFIIGTFYLAFFPVTFIDGKGVTTFKSTYELLLGIGFLVLAIFFFKKYIQYPRAQSLYFSISSYCMALCSFAIVYYLTPSDLGMVWAHLLKIISAAIIYRSVFVEELEHPYLVANNAKELAQQKQLELDTILNNMPLSVIRLTPEFKINYVNDYATQITPALKSLPPNAPLKMAYPQSSIDELTPYLKSALKGNKETINFSYELASGKKVHRFTKVIPENTSKNLISSILCLTEDITEKVNSERDKKVAINDMVELRHALDQHAIVAITDEKGIILSANDKFCEISKYSRDELIGHTHKIINSNYHPKSFFKDMWQTIKSGKVWHGEICNKAKDGSFYWVSSTIVPLLSASGLPERYIAIRADITDRKLAEQKAYNLAMYDDLTKLPNRNHFIKMLANLDVDKINKYKAYHALLFIDLDNFKVINDTMGHPGGDALLTETALRLESIMQPSYHLARLGGDEFIILLTSLDDNKEQCTLAAQQYAEDIRQLISEPYFIQGHEISITPSIGITIFSHKNIDLSELMKQADIAMYQSKDNGRNRVSFFDANLQANIEKRNSLNNALSKALLNQEFTLNYQAIYEQSGRLVGFEALLRWTSETLGFISPAEFIPLLEENNMIIEVGKWVLETACCKLSEWKGKTELTDLTIAVNVSAVQFQQKDFVKLVADCILKYQINPACLKLEITEGIMLIGSSLITKRMKELKELGVNLLLDDFGTGYSSLSYLTRFPIDILKIDKHFVDKMLSSEQDETVVRSIISLASGLKMKVIAEGVETQAQFAYLNQLGCEYYQGYLFAKPVPLISDEDVRSRLVSDKAKID